MIFTILYVFIWSKSKYRKPSIYYIIILAIYGIIYFITKTDILNIKVYKTRTNIKENRIEYLQGLSGWDKYGDGWTSRTNRY